MLFEIEKVEDQVIKSDEQAQNMIYEIQIPCWLNLSLCYLKTNNYHYVLKYTTEVLNL